MVLHKEERKKGERKEYEERKGRGRRRRDRVTRVFVVEPARETKYT